MEENQHSLYHSQTHKGGRKMKRKPIGFIITIVVLALIVIALGVLLFINKTPFDGIINDYQENYPDALLSIQMVKGENAQAAKEQITSFCPDFNLDSYYMAQIDDFGAQISEVHILNPITGATECVIDRTATIETGDPALAQNLLATINGEPVYLDEVNAIYNNIPENQRTNTSMQESLDQVINNKLLLQDAVSKGLTVNEPDVDNSINTFMANNGLTLEQLEENLAAGGSSIADFRNTIRNTLLLQAEINEITKDAATPTEEEIRTYFDANQENLMTIPSGSARQLLVYANESNQEPKLEYVKAIADQFNGTNFCELVNKYSEDTLSVSRCGLYDFQQGQLLPEFEEFVFKSEPGATNIIQTRLGFHIIQVVNVSLSRPVIYEESKDSISNLLLLINQQNMLTKYIQTLKEQAEIISNIG